MNDSGSGMGEFFEAVNGSDCLSSSLVEWFCCGFQMFHVPHLGVWWARMLWTPLELCMIFCPTGFNSNFLLQITGFVFLA